MALLASIVWEKEDGVGALEDTCDSQTGLVMIFLVQHAGFHDEVAKACWDFQLTAIERFGAGRTR